MLSRPSTDIVRRGVLGAEADPGPHSPQVEEGHSHAEAWLEGPFRKRARRPFRRTAAADRVVRRVHRKAAAVEETAADTPPRVEAARRIRSSQGGATTADTSADCGHHPLKYTG